MKWIKRILSSFRQKRFEGALEVVTRRANALYAQKGATVVCVYCGKAMEKRLAGCVYEVATGKMEYSHDECWHQNNHVNEGIPE